MAEQVRAQRKARDAETEQPETAAVDSADKEERDRKLAESEAILDEIDALFEEQGLGTEAAAQAHVENYRQKGGE